jgi:hypothetical protein
VKPGDERNFQGTLDATRAVREGVRLGVRDALAQDIDRTSERTMQRLLAAGLFGFSTASVAVAMFARGVSDRADPMHLALCSAVWSSVLVTAYAFALLRVGSRRLPLAQASAVALLGLAVAAGMGVACPHPMMLDWWMRTPIGDLVRDRFGLEASTLCIGLCVAVVSAGVASFLAAAAGWARAGASLSAALLFVVVWPAIAVQSLGSSPGTLLSWTVGLAIGSLLGVLLSRGLWHLIGTVRWRPAR